MKRLGYILLFTLSVAFSYAQKRSITLDEAINMARLQSVDAAMALNQLKKAYWEFRTFRADLLPEMNFKAVLPSYNKNYTAYQKEDGSYTFLRNNYMGINGSLSIDQNIWLTGGRLSLTTSMDYLKQFDGKRTEKYMSVPIALTLTQPVFGVNDIRWNRRIEPLRYNEAKARFISATEELTMTAINRFFNLLLSKERVITARQNLVNAEKLYEVAKAKREMGQISENDVLQLELNVLEARSCMTSSESELKNSMFALRSFLSIDEDVELDPEIPESLPEIILIYEDVIGKALANNSFARNIRRRQLEADYEVARAKGKRKEISLFAQVGLSGTSNDFSGTFNPLKDNQVIEVGVRIPILDWGKRRGNVKVAESNREVTMSKIKEEEMNFKQNIFMLVENFNNQQKQLMLADKADDIAQRRYKTNVETFMIGRISTLDLNDSQLRKDEARQKHISELFSYWYYYYQIRSLTLWDFVNNTGIDADFDKLVKG